jgi:hypothetical protein
MSAPQRSLAAATAAAAAEAATVYSRTVAQWHPPAGADTPTLRLMAADAEIRRALFVAELAQAAIPGIDETTWES